MTLPMTALLSDPMVCCCLQRGQVLTWQLPRQHGRQTQVNTGRVLNGVSPVWSRAPFKLSKGHSNHTDHAWIPINLYLSVCSERRSRGDRYDSMVSACRPTVLCRRCRRHRRHYYRRHVPVVSPAVCRRCMRLILISPHEAIGIPFFRV